MAHKSRATFQKHEREREKQQKKRDKESRRLEAKRVKSESILLDGNEDPDIAGIKPGPQPLPEQWLYAARLNRK